MQGLKGFCIAALVPLLCAQQIPPPPDAVKFKTQSATVVVDVIVTDGKGNVVPGLTESDFKVFEKGVPQKILSFEPPIVGNAPAAVRPASDRAEVAINSGGRSASLRMITLVIDTGAMRGASLKTSVDAAIQYVDRAISLEDHVAVYAVGSRLRLVVPYSRDKKKVVEGLQSLNRNIEGIQSGTDRARMQGELNTLRDQVQTFKLAGDQAGNLMARMAQIEVYTMEAEMNMFATMQTRALFRGLRAIALASGSLPGRKNVVLFSEGLPQTTETDAGVSSVVDAANRANVAFYVIDPSGLNQDGFMGSFDANNAGNGRRGSNTQAARDLANAQRGSEASGGETKFDTLFRMSADGNRDGLRNLSDKTGGLLIKNRNELKSSLDRIDRDLREYYTLTYQPPAAAFDGTYREIKVEVAGKHTVRYRKGYWALTPGEELKVTPATAQLLTSASNGTLNSAFKPRINASMVFSSATEVSIPVSVWLPGDQNWVTKTDKGVGTAITMVVSARDSQGHMLDVFQKFVEARWTKEEFKEIEKKGLQVIANLTIPKLMPAEIQAVFQFSNGASAVATATVAIPGGEESARLTSLFLTPRVDVVKELRDGDPEALHIANYQLAVPVKMQFTAADKLTVYFGMDGVAIDAASGSPRINLALALKSGDKVIKALPADALYPWPQSKNRIFLLTQFDLAGLPAGNYTLEATLKDLAKKSTTVHGADFSIQ